MAGLAQVYEGIGDLPAAVANYKRLLQFESTNAEVCIRKSCLTKSEKRLLTVGFAKQLLIQAIASIASTHFYSNHPEVII